MFSKRTTIVTSLIVVAAGILFAAVPRDADWAEVQQAIDKGLPKTAIEKLDPIIDQAKRDEAYAEAIKAVALRISLEGIIQGNKPEEKITRMREQIEQAPDKMKPVMEAILANWFWHYFQQNRWRFMQRSQTASLPSEDFTTWDLSRILSEIDEQFEKALAFDDVLKKTPIQTYDDLFEKGNSSDAFRPTLYDVIAQNALDFYTSGEQAGAKSQDAFEISADGPIFSTTEQFLQWDVSNAEQGSAIRKAVSLYQSLLRFHQGDDDPTAFLDVDLQRLDYGNNLAFGEEKSSRFKAALRRFEQVNATHSISSRALHSLAMAIHSGGDRVEARTIAQTGMNRFPNSVGGRRCYNLIQSIEAREMSIQTERVWNDPQPTIDVQYRNLTKVHFRLVPFDFEAFIRSDRWQPDQLDNRRQTTLLSSRPVKSWSADLPETTDYQSRVEPTSIPDDIEPGSYYLVASGNPNFGKTDNQISFAEVWVSDLALILRNDQGKGKLGGFVLSANEGQPIADARIRAWIHNNRNQRIPLPSVNTDRNGMFEFNAASNQQIRIHVTHGRHKLSSSSTIHTHKLTKPRPYEQTQFFTDRTLYRPGQTIQYKGICLGVNQQDDNYETIPSRDVTVVFLDVNNKEIERSKHRTNDYGSFSGSVTAPRDRLMGQMYLRVEGGPRGQAVIRVEEYKRPKFKVALDPPNEPPKLHGDVSVTGMAIAYTGAAVGQAKVSWRVVREVRYPRWWYWRCWWMPQQSGSSQEIAHGVSQTNSNGSFDVKFVAKPDASVLPESEPTFQYSIYADVTDTTGETRSSQVTINVGYTALKASMTSADWLTDEEPIPLTIRTTTLDGKGQVAGGTVKIHALVQPDQVARKTLSGRSVYRYGGSDEPAKPDPSNPDSWETGEIAFEGEFTTDASGQAKLSSNLAAGLYRVTLETQDRFGKPVTAVLPLRVLDPDATKLNQKIPQLFATESTTVEPGEMFSCLWGSGYKTARAFVEVEHRGRLIQSYWTDPSITQKMIQQEVDESMRGGFTVRTTMVRENRAYLHTQHVNVPWSNKKLDVTWEHFVSKLKPAEQETWTAIITGPNAEQHAAEMVATLYDASLDAYQSFNWISRFNVFRRDHSRLQSQFENQQKHLQDLVHAWRVSNRDGSLTYRHFPNQIIQNVWGYGYMARGMEGEMMMQKSDMRRHNMLFSEPSEMQELSAASQVAIAAPMNQFGDVKDKNGPGSASQPDLDQVSARKNLNETAFFFPHLVSGDDGTVKMQFTMPEALTEWKFMGFAHDAQLRGGLLTSTTVTAKDLMVQPNPPRFVREGDSIEFTVKVSNQSPTRQVGTVRLSFTDARTNDPVDNALDNTNTDRRFEIAAGESKTLAWRITVPDEIGYLTYKAVGSTGRLSDGEEGFLPVLSRRVLVTESLPLPIRGATTKDFQFTKLLHSDDSDSLSHQSLTVQMVSNPSWYAVMALPYLMEYPHQCSEQTFNRLYANSLARHIAISDPKIDRVFQQWRNTPALDSPLEKNEELKAVMLDETPWVRQAADESQARRNVGVLLTQTD